MICDDLYTTCFFVPLQNEVKNTGNSWKFYRSSTCLQIYKCKYYVCQGMCLSLAVRLRLAFANMLDAAVFSILLQRKLPQLPWPEGLKQRGDLDEGGDGFLLQI